MIPAQTTVPRVHMVPHSCRFVVSTCYLIAIVWLISGAERVAGGDWPQVLGPQRNSRANESRPLAEVWDKVPPKLAWRAEASSGYAGAAIQQGVVFLFDREAGNERLRAVDLLEGKQLWQALWPATYTSRMDPDSGPRAVPAVSQGRVVCYGAAGDLVCIDTQQGKIAWQRPLRKELVAEDGYFGAGSSPLISGQVVIVNVGGKKAGIVGIDLLSGKTLWQATDYEASYASPIELLIDNRPAALVVTRLRTVLLDVATGKVFSEIDFGARGPTVNAATPLALSGDQILLTASYGIGAHLLQLKGSRLERLWKNPDLLASQYNSPVQLGSMIVGVNGREDMGEVALKGLDVEQPKVLWEQSISGPSHLIAVNDQLLQLSIDGGLTLSSVATKGLKTLGTVRLAGAESGGLFRALPALSNKVLVVRRTISGTRGEFMAYQLP